MFCVEMFSTAERTVQKDFQTWHVIAHATLMS